MKIVLIIVALIAVLIALIVVVGWLLPKHHTVTRSALLKASPERLFALISGPQNWRPDVLNSEDSTDAGGRRFERETTRNKETITYELLDSAPPSSIKRRIATENLPYAGTWTFSLQGVGDSTAVRITEDGDVYNPVFRFVSRFILGHASTIDAYLRAMGKATGQDVQPSD